MLVLTKIAEIRENVERMRAASFSIGFVPTMGGLHEGHLSLVRQSVLETGFTVASIFVNPSQFGPTEDFAAYPRTLEHDAELLAREECDTVFAPSAAEIYPEGFNTWVVPKGPEATDLLCGYYRPQHFTGVLTVVLKLLQIVRPDIAYFGQKDYQQAWLIQRMARDLNLDVAIRVRPTVREADGLAMSSRNQYLSPEERRAAPVLHRALGAGQALLEQGGVELPAIQAAMAEVLAGEPRYRSQYLEILDATSLRAPGEPLSGELLLALAGTIGETRLIDNALVQVPALPHPIPAGKGKGAAHVA